MANPTGVRLPALVYDQKTRVGGEFYLYYNLGCSYYFGAIGYDGATAQYRAEASCGSPCSSIPASGVGCVRSKVALKAVGDTVWTAAGGLTGTLPAYSPPGQAAETGTLTAVNSATVGVTGATAGDSVDVIVLPNPTNDVLLCYDRGLSVDIGDETRAVTRKFQAVDHFVRQRADNKISLKDLYCCNLQGLSLLRQRDITLIGKFYPDGGAVPSEILYWTGVRLNVPKNIPEEANDSVQVDASGVFRDQLAFSARPS